MLSWSAVQLARRGTIVERFLKQGWVVSTATPGELWAEGRSAEKEGGLRGLAAERSSVPAGLVVLRLVATVPQASSRSVLKVLALWCSPPSLAPGSSQARSRSRQKARMRRPRGGYQQSADGVLAVPRLAVVSGS